VLGDTHHEAIIAHEPIKLPLANYWGQADFVFLLGRSRSSRTLSSVWGLGSTNIDFLDRRLWADRNTFQLRTLQS
jgi:hypothetical protein